MENYSIRKRVFDDASDLWKVAVELSHKVLKCEGEKDKIFHLSACTSLKATKNFFESQDVARIRIDSGVRSPEFIYLDHLDYGEL